MRGFKGTKGKWIEHKHAKGNVQSETGRNVASCMGYSNNSDNGAHVIENLANAKLIIAAPDLLENLIRCVDRLEENDMGQTSAVRRAKEAINKALD